MDGCRRIGRIKKADQKWSVFFNSNHSPQAVPLSNLLGYAVSPFIKGKKEGNYSPFNKRGQKIHVALSLNKDIILPAKNLALSFISYCNANEIINAKTSGYLCSITHYWRNLMIPFGKSPVP
jgi:hypothetical protein